jgi:hypothetical protein
VVTDWHERFDAKWQPEPTSGCWLWVACTSRGEYGRFWLNGRYEPAHRVAFERWIGLIPDGMTIDHVRARGCGTTQCVNPEHLEPVTIQVNILRGECVSARFARATHCVNGHAFDGQNTYLRPGGGRSCRACHRIRAAAQRSR